MAFLFLSLCVRVHVRGIVRKPAVNEPSHTHARKHLIYFKFGSDWILFWLHKSECWDSAAEKYRCLVQTWCFVKYFVIFVASSDVSLLVLRRLLDFVERNHLFRAPELRARTFPNIFKWNALWKCCKYYEHDHIWFPFMKPIIKSVFSFFYHGWQTGKCTTVMEFVTALME